MDSAGFAGTTSLAFEEVHSGHHDDPGRAPHYCFAVDERGEFVNRADGRAQWNLEHVPGDTLWIQVLSSLGEGADTSVGYQPSSEPRAFGRHLMRLGPRVSVDAIAHEVSRTRILRGFADISSLDTVRTQRSRVAQADVFVVFGMVHRGSSQRP